MTVLERSPRSHLIGGTARGALGGETIDVLDPATGEVIGSIPAGTDEDARAAVAAARAAAPAWARREPAERAELLKACARALRAAADELAEIQTRENGKPLGDSRAGVEAGIGTIEQYAELGPLHGGSALAGSPSAVDATVREPHGVAALIVPWNDPVAIACGQIAAALVTGNAAVFKPSERTPLSGARLAELMELPPGVLNLLLGDGRAGRALAEHPGVVRAIAPNVDLILLAGDLTTHGEPSQAAFLADACEGIRPPVVTVLGNHDHHSGRGAELATALEDAGIAVLERSSRVYEIDGVEVGVVGAKGFVGGFAGSHLPDFGEPLLRQLYRETSEEVDAIGEGLVSVAHCPVRIVLLHYAPIEETLAGEPPGIYTFLGSSRLADPIREHEPDLVLHGHAHAGSFEGSIGTTPVHNVSVPVMKQDFWIFELRAGERPAPPIH